MCLVPAEHYDHSRPQSLPPSLKSRPSVKTTRVVKKGKTDKQDPHDKWVALRTKVLEADINESDLIHRLTLRYVVRRVLCAPFVDNCLLNAPQLNSVPYVDVCLFSNVLDYYSIDSCRLSKM